jgi:hypothetical protein
MMRNDKGLGVLRWATDTMYLVSPDKTTLTKEERQKMKIGYYINKEK